MSYNIFNLFICYVLRFCITFDSSNNNAMKKTTKKQVKILGQMVTVGTKEYIRLTEQVRIFNQSPKNEI